MAFVGYRLRGTEGEFEGLWLTGMGVTKNGLLFRGSVDWKAVARQPRQYQFTPTFSADENFAWGGFTNESAETFQSILAYLDIKAEIVEPPQTS